ncbi:transmembrane protein 71 isoform X2 [Denticeps clupeoides]|uniref:transmembrane protein 71 isoform X2 n=1 Tax=Denticeps clupeoides TaxID=299321 RepID=UPI0010A4024E|nr:transmembrane protein 71 isoform X2 [Denticeps clupeoides]
MASEVVRKMAFFFRGAVTSSPIKTRSSRANMSCLRLDDSFFSDYSYECFSANPLTGSLCQCRRSPRLLANGYYVITEDSIVAYDEGSITLTPSKTNVSYKENLVRIFRRRRRARRSLASLLKVFGRSDPTPLEEPTWDEHGHTPFRYSHTPFEECFPSHDSSPASFEWSHSCSECGHMSFQHSSTPMKEMPLSFTYDSSAVVSTPDKMKILEEEERRIEASPVHEFSQSVGGLLEVPPPSEFIHNSYSSPACSTSDGTLTKAFLLLIIFTSLCAAVFSRWEAGGVAVVITFVVMVTSLFLSKPSGTVKWSRTKTEDITSRNE